MHITFCVQPLVFICSKYKYDVGKEFRILMLLCLEIF